ncbi:tetraspanin-18 [Sesamum indicum]|uniref:Tetraspanin-18 n=1 Tax=Sesamum indicum TaxID=4182 RepID=A0A6I9TEE9_SESIN|nr:tetraspanin-18 [Sesamum indicum]
MGTSSCQTFLAFILKCLNFLQAFVGVAMVIYSAYMLSQWQHRGDEFPPPAPSHDVSGIHLSADVVNHLNLALGDNALHVNFHSLPAPWFIYAFMGIGVIICCITCIGNIAAESINGCCLCSYALLTTVFLLLEVGLVALVAFDRHWKKDLPFDPTGELDNLMAFIEDNMDILKWVGIAILIIQALSLLFATILRSMVSSRDVDDDIEAEYDYSSREPLLIPRPSQACGSPRGDSDIWSSRMRQKYGLNTGDSKAQFIESKPVN